MQFPGLKIIASLSTDRRECTRGADTGLLGGMRRGCSIRPGSGRGSLLLLGDSVQRKAEILSRHECWSIHAVCHVVAFGRQSDYKVSLRPVRCRTWSDGAENRAKSLLTSVAHPVVDGTLEEARPDRWC
jgi:hypothetical protein